MREKLIELLMQKGFGVEGATIATDHLIANGVTIKIKKEKNPTDEFGKSNYYVICTNKEKYWKHRTSMFKQKSTPACKRYKVKENDYA